MSSSDDLPTLEAEVAAAKKRLAEVDKGNDTERLDVLVDLALAREALLVALTEARGSDDFITIVAQWNLAATRYELGDLEQAKPLMEEALGRLLRTKGSADMATVKAMEVLSTVLSARGEYQELETLQQDRINYRIHAHGDDLEVDRLRCQLADTKRTLGDLNGAAELWSRAIQGLDKSIGPRSKEAIRARADLASVLYSTGRLVEGRRALGEARDLATRSLDHRDEVRLAVERLASMIGAADAQLARSAPITRGLAKAILRLRARRQR